MFKTAILLPFLGLLAIVCTASAADHSVQSPAEAPAYPCIADIVTVLDARNGVYLVLRTTGFQKKEDFFEVYRGRPEFEACGYTQTPLITTEPYDQSRGMLKKLELHGNHLEIIYTHNRSEAIKLREARLPR